jgi:hypothetical protein
LAAEQDRMAGIKGLSIDQFAENMKKAIEESKKRTKQAAKITPIVEETGTFGEAQ